MKVTRSWMAIALLHLPFPAAASAQQPDAEGIRYFETNIRPILIESCYRCHSAEAGRFKGGLRVDTRDGLLLGGDSGPAVVPGSPENSLLFRAVMYDDPDLEMPPTMKLSDESLEKLRRWIEMGAPDPRTEVAAAAIRTDIDLNAGREYWAYQRPVKQIPSSDPSDSWARTPIDRFVWAGFDTNGVKPVGDAEAAVLVRRLYFVIAGLPPSTEDARRWTERIEDQSDHAKRQLVVAELVDELLASPQYGERWGQHWLDVARYAESTGGDHNNIYQHAWRYRDYVIDSFNDDKPFNQFIREQIAGDLLPIADDHEWANNIIATGFLAIGSKNVGEENQHRFFADLVDEQIDVTTRAFLAMTTSCARCHDHKYDPIPQSDYYAMAGIFRSTETHYGLISAQARQSSTLLDLTGLGPPAGTRQLTKSEFQDLLDARDAASEELDEAMRSIRSGEDVFRGTLRRLRTQRDVTEVALQSYTEDGTPRVFGMGTQDREIPLTTHLLVRGELDNRAQEVPRGLLQVLSPPGKHELPSGTQGSGRLELADWIADESNPLTARVIANRVWHWMYGKGLVVTVDDFGRGGTDPTHPELLDYLAVRLVELDWSIKALIREIALSRSWQLSSEFDAANFEVDPDNDLLWRYNKRRLEGETIRDSMLAVSGRLDLNRPLGTYLRSVGEGVVGQNVFEPAIQDISPRTRSVYLPRVRNVLPQLLSLFDAPDASLVMGARETTLSPLQSLFLMNDEFVQDQAVAIASEIEGGTGRELIEQVYLRLFSRPPTEPEYEYGLAFLSTLEEQSSHGGRNDGSMTPLEIYCQALLATMEFQMID